MRSGGPPRPELPTLRAALTRARSLAFRGPPEWVPLVALADRTLAAAVVPRQDLPPGDVAAMDGWAVRSQDTARPLRIVGESAAGAPPRAPLDTGEALRISTGALLPAGADAVIRLEDAREEAGVLAPAPASPGKDVRRRGEDLSTTRAVLPAGARLAAHDVGVVAACGGSGAWCVRRPRLAILATGSELAEPGDPPGEGRVYDSNRHGLRAQAEAAGARVVRTTRLPDDPRLIEATLASALLGPEACDVVVVAGGLSVGPHDHVRRALARIGVQIAVESIALRPGRPTLIGRVAGATVLGLPGTPAAAALGFHVLGRALLGAEAPWTERPLGASWRSRRRLDELLRCKDSGGVAVPLERQGSAAVSSLAGADLVAWLPWGREAFERGDPVRTNRLP